MVTADHVFPYSSHRDEGLIRCGIRAGVHIHTCISPSLMLNTFLTSLSYSIIVPPPLHTVFCELIFPPQTLSSSKHSVIAQHQTYMWILDVWVTLYLKGCG